MLKWFKDLLVKQNIVQEIRTAYLKLGQILHIKIPLKCNLDFVSIFS